MVSRRTVLGAGVAAAGFAATGGYVAWSGESGSDGGSGPELGTVEFFPPRARREAPAVAGELLDGAPFDLADWNGRVVVMNWWGSWCAPCRAEAEDLRAVHDATHELGVEFLEGLRGSSCLGESGSCDEFGEPRVFRTADY